MRMHRHNMVAEVFGFAMGFAAASPSAASENPDEEAQAATVSSMAIRFILSHPWLPDRLCPWVRCTSSSARQSATGQAFTPQISVAYSWMVRSLENLPEAGDVVDDLARPCVAVACERRQAARRRRDRPEVGEMHVVVAVGEQRLPQRLEDARLIAAEMVGEDEVERPARLRLVVVVPVGAVPAAAAWRPDRPSGRTGRSSPRPPPRPFRSSRRRGCRASAPRSS